MDRLAALHGKAKTAGIRTEVVLAALLMAGSLTMVLTAGALARELGTRYAAGEVLFLRFLISLAVVGPAALAMAGRRAVLVHRPCLHAIRAVTGVVAALIFYAATQRLPFADLVALSYSAPIFVAVLSRLLIGERVRPLSGVCIALGLLGVFIVAPPMRLEAWSLAALVMAALNAVCILVTRQATKSDGPAATALVFVLAGTVLTLPAALADFRMPSVEDGPTFLLLGGAAGLAIILNVLAFRRAPAAVLAPIDYLGIMASVVIGCLWWDETPTMSVVLGGALITATGLANTLLGSGTEPRRIVQRPV